MQAHCHIILPWQLLALSTIKFIGDIAGIFGLKESEFLYSRHGGNGPRATHRCFGTAMVDVCKRLSELAGTEPAVQAIAITQELSVRAHLDDQAPVHCDDEVSIYDRREPMGDDEGSTILQQVSKRGLNQGLTCGVERVLVASSRKTTDGFLQTARAIATLPSALPR